MRDFDDSAVLGKDASTAWYVRILGGIFLSLCVLGADRKGFVGLVAGEPSWELARELSASVCED
jgi:hypothetical protein